MGAATSAQVDRATTVYREKGGLLSSRLVESGVGATSVLAVLASSSGLPPAPRSALQAPDAALRGRFKGESWRKFRAAPFGTRDGKLLIAFANPEALRLEAAQRLPPHTAFVAMEEDVLRLQELLFGSPSRELPLHTPLEGLEPLGPAAPAAALTQLGDYKVSRLLGSGGMANVYLTQDVRSGRQAALKVMLPHLAQDPTFVQRFVHEAKSSAALEHEHIVRVLSFGEEDGRYHIASELMDGGSVEALLEKQRKLPAPVVAELVAQALRGAAYAHARGVIHRDLKPGNLLLSAHGVLKLADFGIAKRVGGTALTQTGATLGTPAYMSPEQASGQPLDGRSDLFSLGVILFELLSGQNPYLAESAVASLSRLLYAAKPSLLEAEPSVPEVLERVADRLLERDPARRFASAAEALQALEPYVDAERRRTPELLARYLANPDEVGRAMLARRRDDCLATARRLMSGPDASPRRAALSLQRALTLDPEHRETQELAAVIRAAEHVIFTEPDDARLPDLKRKLYESPEPADALRSIAELFRGAGYVFGAFVYFKRYLHLRPDDAQATAALAQLQGERKARAEVSAPSEPGAAARVEPAPAPRRDRRMSATVGILAIVAAIALSGGAATLLALALRSASAPAPAARVEPTPVVATPPPASKPAVDLARYESERRAIEERRVAQERRNAEIRAAYDKQKEADAKRHAAEEEAAAESDSDDAPSRPSTRGDPRGVPSMPSVPRGGW